MERRIISDAQITASSTFNSNTHKGKEARLNNNRCWCSATATQTNQWVRIDLEKPLRVTGIAIQGDPNFFPNYIKKFKLKYSIDGTLYDFIRDGFSEKVYVGASGQGQLIKRSFEICNKGLGIESGLSLPSGFVLTASSFVTGNEAIKGRLSGALSWCANTNNANEYIQIDFGKTITMTGIAVQGNPTASSWVNDFYVEYGITETSLAPYTEKGVNKLFVGNANQSTIVVNWFQVRLKARYVRVKPNTFNGNKCMRFEIIGCDTDFIAEAGAENRVLDDSKFSASGYFQTIFSHGRYLPKDGRLHNDRPWGNFSSNRFWFKVDLGRTMLVNGIATQGDTVYTPNYFSDYKLQFSQSNANFVSIKSEGSSSIKIFAGNTNNVGVKFNLLKVSPISTRYVQFLKNTETLHDDTLRVEIYALPQVCSSSFGMEAGEPSTYEPTITVSTGIVPSSKAKINSNAAWCAGNAANTHHFTFDFGKVKQISGVAIQGHPSQDKWVKKFKIQYGSSLSSLTTYSEGNSEKEFIGCNSRNLIVYNWFSTEITARYLRILPIDSNNEVCLRLSVYGCPSTECFKRIGIGSSATIANSLLTASTYSTGNEAFKSRFNSLTTWVACQVGSCTSKEATGNKPWIQLCLGSAYTFSAVVIQGHGDQDNIADVKTFSVQYKYTQAGTIYDYKLDGTNKIFSASPGRYGSKQADFPIAIAAKCLRIKVESQTDTLKNVGLRWELLGCNAVTKTSVTLTTSSLSIARGSKSTVTCSATGQEGGGMSYKASGSGTTITNSDIYSLGTQTRTNANINGVIQRNIEITANGPSVGSSFTSCSITDSAQAKPQAPTGFGANSITVSSAKVTWTASVARDVPVENYKVSIKMKSDGTSAGTDQTVTMTEVMFTNLTPFTEYTVEVKAKSRTFNIYSPIGTHSFKTDEGVATAPTNITLTPLSATEITVTWKTPVSMNGSLHDYQIRYKKLSDLSFLPLVNAGTGLSKTIDKLNAYTYYEFQVAARTKGGTIMGAFSSSVAERTQEGPASMPMNVTAMALSNRTILVIWEGPEQINGALHDYQIRYKKSSEFSFLPNVNAGTGLSKTINKLDAYTYYEFQVAARTKVGTIIGAWSNITKARTQEGSPTAPINVTALSLSDTVIRITWKEPEQINGLLHDYQSRYKKSLDSSFLPNVNAGRNLSHSIKNLRAFTSYDFQVSATTKLGAIIGAWSNITMARTQEGSPTAPVNVTALSLSDTVIRITWKEPEQINGLLHHYQIRYKKSSEFSFLSNVNAGTGLSKTINKLDAYTYYEFQVAARTKVGAIIGAWSNITMARTQEGSLTAPVNVTALPLSDTVIRIAWKEPEQINGLLHDFQIRYKKSSEFSFLPNVNAGRNLSHSIKNLQVFTSYDFQVTATTKLGAIIGAWSNITMARTQEGSPTAPVNVTALSLSDTVIRITWKEPEQINGLLHDYQIRYKKSSEFSFLPNVNAGTGLSKTIDKLDAYTYYEFQVAARTKVGTIMGPWSNITRARTQEGSPTAPVNVTALSLSDTVIRITWKEPKLINGLLHDYQIRYKKSLDSSFLPNVNAGRNLSHRIKNLHAFTSYDFQVTATTKLGAITGTWSTSTIEKTKQGSASKPIDVRAIPISEKKIIVTWKEPLSINGILHNYQIRFKKSSEKTFLTIVVSANKLSKILDNLDAFTDYVIQVAATTKQGTIFGDWSDSIRERTHESVPLEPKALHVVSTQSRSTVLKWDKPSKENGIIRNYTIRLRGTKGYNTTFRHEKSIVLSVNSSTRLSLGVSDLVPGSVYTVQIAAATIKGYDPYSSSITLRTLYTEPLAPEIVREVQLNGGTNVILKPASNINGPITHYAFGVTIGIKGCRLELHREIIKPSRIPLTLRFVPGSETVPGISFKFNKIGNFTLCFRAVTVNMSQLLFGKPSSTVIEQTTLLGTPEPNPTRMPTDETDAQSNQTQMPFNTGYVSIITVLVLIIIVLVVVVVILRRRKPSSSPQKDIEPIPMAQYASLGANRAYEYDGYESLTMETNISNKETRDVTTSGSSAASVRHKQPPSHVEIHRHHQPIAVHNFAEFSRNLQKDCHRALSLEYNKLKKGQLYSWDIAMTAANQSKNRYPNIAAYDHSRVHLQPLAGQTNIDYFNANLISSYNRPSVYIAAQDPLHGNEAAFWRMNWDNNVPAIIMLSNMNEGAETQCANYWPHQGKIQFGDISIALDLVDSDPDFVIRRFTVSRKGQSESRIVYQFQFLSWPGSGVPKFSTDILRFRQTVRKNFRFETKPSIVVHCTDGIGRTGSFIVIDAMLDLAAKEQTIDIFNYVNFIRTQRIELVSAEEQYSFIYDALLEATMRVSTEFEADDIKTTAAQLQVLNNGKTGYQMQFELLNSVTHCFSTIETLNALKPENERRNRNKNILPRDSYRVVLQESIYENASSDYVNATFVDGYKREYGFIATEHPLPKTMAAFWSIVLENNVTMIVMLNELKEGSLKYPTFWPSVGSETKYGQILVKNQSSSDKEEKDLTHIMIHIRHGSMAKNSREVDMYQFHYWPNHATPKNTSQLLSLLNKLNVSESNKQQGNNKHSTLVMCSDGAGRTGTFIAIANILERLKSEQLIDVFHTVKKIRLFRPQFVENSAQYQFCFKMAQAYMESFEDNYIHNFSVQLRGNCSQNYIVYPPIKKVPLNSASVVTLSLHLSQTINGFQIARTLS
eukprot:gene8095-8963_t